VSSRHPYEPSVQSIFRAVLPAGTHVDGDEAALRARGLWPRVLRATGLGEIQGGEIVLVPRARVTLFLRHCRELARAGVAAAIVPSSLTTGERLAASGAGIALAVVDESTDIRTMQAEIERYVIRRRKELFDASQRLHRLLVEAAIAGASLPELVRRAADDLGRPVAIDRDGDVVGSSHMPACRLPWDSLLQIRIEMARSDAERLYIDLEKGLAAAAVLTGNERRGTAIVTDVEAATLDEDEVLLATLTAACAIALSRETAPVYPSLTDLLSSPVPSPASDRAAGPWTCLAVSAPGSEGARAARALGAELSARDADHQIAREGEVAIALISGHSVVAPDDVCRSVAVRLGAPSTRAGLSRMHTGSAGRMRAAREALAACRHADEAGLVRFETIELTELFAAVPDWEYFVTARLGPLLDGSSASDTLLLTLSVYLSCGRNAVEAARRLHIHRNTLRYRLRSIQRLLGTDLDGLEEPFALDLALRLFHAHGGRVNQVSGSD
jgi:purine catabolism regulator